jgi:hypothetical protein
MTFIHFSKEKCTILYLSSAMKRKQRKSKLSNTQNAPAEGDKSCTKFLYFGDYITTMVFKLGSAEPSLKTRFCGTLEFHKGISGVPRNIN